MNNNQGGQLPVQGDANALQNQNMPNQVTQDHASSIPGLGQAPAQGQAPGQGQVQGQTLNQDQGQVQAQAQGQGHGQTQGQTQGQVQGQGSQQGRISFQAIHQHARQLLRQYSIEKAEAEKKGIATPEGRAHMMKADKIKDILVKYSKRQKLLQQQQQQQQQQQKQAQAQPQQQQQQQLQQNVQTPNIQQQGSQAQSTGGASNAGTPMLNMAGSPSMQMGTPQSEPRSISQQLNSIEASIINGNSNTNLNTNTGANMNTHMAGTGISNAGTPNINANMSLNASPNPNTPVANVGNIGGNGNKYDPSMVQLTPAQQLQLKKQQLLNKYQQIITMSEQFKKNMVLIQKRLQEPNLDEAQKKHLQEKEHEVKVRLENCKKCTHQIANQLKIAQQQATQLSQINRSQTSSPQPGQGLGQNRGPVLNNRVQPQGSPVALPVGTGNMAFNNTTVNGQVYSGLSAADAAILGVNSPGAGIGTMKLNSAAGTPGTPGTAGKNNNNAKTTKKPAAAKKNATKADSAKRPADGDAGNANKKQKGVASGPASATNTAGTGISAGTSTSTVVTGGNASLVDGKKSATVSSVSTGVDSLDRAKFQNLNIPDDLTVRSHDPVSVKVNNRPSQLGGNAISATSLTNPIMVRPPQFEIEGERVLNKRKLKELVASVASEEGEVEINIDGDVEELLLDLADEFVTSVTSFASRLARHRHSDNLDVRDVQLHLERNWNIRVPGYATDEIRMLRKFVPGSVQNAKINGVSINKSVDKAP